MEPVSANGKKKYKVAQYVYNISDGGAETLIKDYALLLDKEQFDVVIIVMSRAPKTANDQILQAANIRIIPVHTGKLVGRVLNKLNNMGYVSWKLGRILRREKVDVLHVHLSELRYVGRISQQLKGTRLFYTCHSVPERFLGKEEVPAEHRAAQKLLRENGLQIIALHDDMRQQINRMFNIDNTVVIRNGIDFKRFQITESKAEIRTRLRIPKDAYVVGHVGRFSAVKNHAFLVDIFKTLRARKENAFLLLVGVGELCAQTEEKLAAAGCRDACLILSNRADMPQILKAMDVFVFPSLYEGFPLALLEAQVTGLRCIISDTISKEAILRETTIPVSLQKTPAEWCDAILNISLRTSEYGNIDDYDLAKEIKRLERLYVGELNG